MQPAEGNVEGRQLRTADKGADGSQGLGIARRQILIAYHQRIRPRRQRPGLHVPGPGHAQLAADHIVQGDVAMQDVAQEMGVGYHRRTVVAHDIDSRVAILGRQFMGLHVQGAAVLLCLPDEAQRIVAHRFMSHHTAHDGIGKFVVVIDGLAGLAETAVQYDPQQGVVRSGIGRQPRDRRTHAKLKGHQAPSRYIKSKTLGDGGRKCLPGLRRNVAKLRAAWCGIIV
jgi:hypothetical protein